jgi:hypothetical protein
VRSLALTLLAMTALVTLPARADEVDLSQTQGQRNQGPAEFILKAQGGSTFAPYGYIGGALSWLVGSNFELEGGAGAGFPGLQLGLAARTVFNVGEENAGQFLLGELSIAGNTKVNRASNQQSNPTIAGQSSLWTSLGFGGELRKDFFAIDLVASIVFTTSDLTPHFAIHGGIGFGL